ncbi:MAG TPA: TIM barrel protein [Clostridiaceae bacterium]|nr:TIM barrel protein [Clostridiaceae bacterium]
MIRFGPSGNSQSFYDQGFKSSLQMPGWLAGMGLNAYEYQCNRGVNIRESTAKAIGEEALKNNVFISIHAPYYINLSSQEESKRTNSKNYILDTMKVANWMQAERVVVHTGSCTKMDRRFALELAIQVLRDTIKEADSMGLSHITICPEVLGKVNQLGTIEEIVEMCKIDERLIPTIDFGHIHARGMGSLNTPRDFENIIDYIGNELGTERMKRLHIHFSRVEYSQGGEKKHWTMEDTQYGPEFEHLAVVLIKKKMEPVIICESRDFMAEDALKMKKIYENLLNKM